MNTRSSSAWWPTCVFLAVGMTNSFSVGAQTPEEGSSAFSDSLQSSVPGVRKMSDVNLTCAQIHKEASNLESSMFDRQATAKNALVVAEASRKKMIEQSSRGLAGLQSGASTVTGLLSMIPGVGMVAGMVGGAASQASLNSRMAEMEENTNKMVQAQQQALELAQAMSSSQARYDHLVELALKKNCEVSR